MHIGAVMFVAHTCLLLLIGILSEITYVVFHDTAVTGLCTNRQRREAGNPQYFSQQLASVLDTALGTRARRVKLLATFLVISMRMTDCD